MTVKEMVAEAFKSMGVEAPEKSNDPDMQELVAARFKGFFPQNAMDLFEAAPLVHGADERVPVEDLGLAARAYSRLVQEMLR